jgi:hypothetical protein
MSDVNELWSSPWIKLQKSLASGLRIAPVTGLAVWPLRNASKVIPADSWLIRARDCKGPRGRSRQVPPRVQ